MDGNRQLGFLVGFRSSQQYIVYEMIKTVCVYFQLFPQWPGLLFAHHNEAETIVVVDLLKKVFLRSKCVPFHST